MDHGGSWWQLSAGPSAARPRWYPVTAACLDEILHVSLSRSAFGPVTRRILQALQAAPLQYEQYAQHAVTQSALFHFELDWI